MTDDERAVFFRKECDCRYHTGPHWIHADQMTFRNNLITLRQAVEDEDPFSFMAYTLMEQSRNYFKLGEMQRRGILCIPAEFLDQDARRQERELLECLRARRNQQT